MIYETDELYHYGVKGMRCGHRRALPTSDLRNRYDRAKAAKKAVKKERKQAIRDTHKQLEKQASFKEKLTYNSATRKKAAKYIVDNNMSVSEATKKAKGDAWRNSAALVATYAAIGVGVGVAYMNNH